MNNYSKEDLEKIVSDLISQKSEGDYWDFKQEWHSENWELVKDIICFANTPHNRDCFIIFGVDDKNHKIVPFQSKRKNQADVLSILSDNRSKFAAENIPEISVFSDIMIGEGMVDVLVIFNSNLTPFYLSERYGKLKDGLIYSRTRDRNSPTNENSSPKIIEELWRKRQGLLLPPLEQFYFYLQKTENWSYSDYENGYFNIYRPEFTFVKDDNSHREFESYYTKALFDPRTICYQWHCKFHQTIMKTISILSMSGSRFFSPIPDYYNLKKLFDDDENHIFYYFIEDSPMYSIQKILNKDSDVNDYLELFYNLVPFFKSELEKNNFLSWLKNNKKIFDDFFASNDNNLINLSSNWERSEKAIGKTIVQLLKLFRQG